MREVGSNEALTFNCSTCSGHGHHWRDCPFDAMLIPEPTPWPIFISIGIVMLALSVGGLIWALVNL